MAVLPVIRLSSTSVEVTRDVARALAALVVPGDVIVLSGDLGAGKTAFTQGLGDALGVTEPLVSPTFTIERIYEGRVRLHHLDVYRLGHIHEALDLGLSEALDDGDVAVVEWGDAVAAALGLDALHVELALGAGDDDRTITVDPAAVGWAARELALVECLAPWTVEAAGSEGDH